MTGRCRQTGKPPFYLILTGAGCHEAHLQRAADAAMLLACLSCSQCTDIRFEMICYQLVCKKSHSFEGWFRDSAAFDTQAKKGLLACPTCNSKSVQKAPMAPAVSKKGELSEVARQARDMREWVTRVRKHVEDNAEYVGEKFPEVARAMHYGDAQERQVYGEASLDDARELVEEGIPVAPIPSLPRTDS